jgi:pyruvate dehydrogenase E2 component (dihydrolipoamide acetyltransferase)
MGEQPVNFEGDVVPILMPQPDQTVEECVIARWLVRPGDRIEKGQVIFEAETTKAVFEVEAEQSGRLARIVIVEDRWVPVRTPVAYLAENDAVLDAWLAANPPAQMEEEVRTDQQGLAQTASQVVEALPSTSVSLRRDSPDAGAPRRSEAKAGEIKASPAARRLADKHGIDLRTLGPGSGPEGRIVVPDVEKAIAAAPMAGSEESVRRPLSPMRRAIARVVTASKQTIPHFYVKATIQAEPALRFCEACKARFACGLNDVVVMACAKAVREFPAFRSRLDGDEVVTLPSANIGILVAVEDGLAVPVVRGADRMTFEHLAQETRRVIAAAREGRVEGLGEAVFTVSNLGKYGVEEFSAIIHPPEAAILAVGAVRDQAIVRDNVVVPCKMMTLTLSCDHRLIDGVQAARFLVRLKELIENPGPLDRSATSP